MINVEALLVGNKSPNTVINYLGNWRNYMAFAGDDATALQADTLLRWRQVMVESTSLAANTINVRMRSVKSIIHELALHKQVSREIAYEFRDVPCLKKGMLRERRRKNYRVRIEPEQMRKICSGPTPTPDNPMDVRDRALLLTLATTGMRISEVVGIKIDDVHKGQGGYLIVNILGKGQSEARSAPISHDAYDAIQDWLHIRPVQSPYVFSDCRPSNDDGTEILYSREAMGKKVIYHMVKRWARRAGMPAVKPHDFRRFVGTQVVKKHDIRTAQRVLGHASISTTAAYYVLDDVKEGVTDDLF